MSRGRILAAISMLAGSLFLQAGMALGEPWDSLPKRVMKVEGGHISYQGAVILDTRGELQNIYVQNYPIKYILPTRNRSDRPLWVEAEWRVPGDEPFTSFVRLGPNDYAVFFSDTKKVIWDQPVPVGLTVYADEGKKQKLAGSDVTLLFRGEERAAFLKEEQRINTHSEKSAIAHGKAVAMPIVSGIQE